MTRPEGSRHKPQVMVEKLVELFSQKRLFWHGTLETPLTYYIEAALTRPMAAIRSLCGPRMQLMRSPGSATTWSPNKASNSSRLAGAP